jgi:hypothetical protein
MVIGPRGRSGGGPRTGGGRGLWAERRAAAAPPAEVVEEIGWARVCGRGGIGEEPMTGSSVEADPVETSLWAADPAAKEPPGLGREGSAAGTSGRSG